MPRGSVPTCLTGTDATVTVKGVAHAVTVGGEE